MTMAAEQTFGKAQVFFSQLEAYIQASASKGERADTVEREVFKLVLKVGLEFLDGYFKQVGDGNVGETVERDGKVLKSLGSADRTYGSIFGELVVSRHVYALRAKQKTYAPLDAQLGLPEVNHSFVLQDWLTRLCVKNSFDDSVLSLRDLLGLNVSKRTAEKLNEDIGGYVESFRESRPVKFDDDEEILVVSADGKGVPMRSTIEERNGLPETPQQKCHRKKQEKKAPGRAKRRRARGKMKVRKQMAYIGAVFTIESWIRTRDHVIGEVLNKESVKRPQPVNKRVQAVMTNYVAGEKVDGQKVLFADFKRQLEKRDPKSKKKLVCLMDGQRTLWDLQRKYLPDAVPIIDIFHVSERLWEAAYCFHPESSAEAEDFVCHYYKMLLDGKVDTVIRSLRGKLRGLTKPKRKRLLEVIKYYGNNRQSMKYDEYLKQGFPIGSGAIEGACRHLVKDRMERTGMRWQIEGAQAMLNTRSASINGEWDDLLNFRIAEKLKCQYGQTT